MAADRPCRASTASRLDRIRGQRGVLVHVEIPGMSLNLQDPLLRLTGIHPRQTGGPLFCQILTDFARGARRANSTPGPARGFCLCEKAHISCMLKARLACHPARCLLPVEIIERCDLATGLATVELLPYLLPC